MNVEFGKMLPRIGTPIPGPKSVALARKLAQYESCGLSLISSKGIIPVFWEEGKGANVRDVDGNVFVDCTAGFGVAAVGHANPAVVEAIRVQSAKLTHAMADIFPHPARAALVERLVNVIGRESDTQVILTNTGSEAVEVAIKTAVLYTRKSGIISFCGGFHGQSIGALGVSSQRAFRDPFIEHISGKTIFVPFPNPYRPALGADASNVSTACLDYINSILLDEVSGVPEIGAVIVEPIQNINGYVVPPDDFLVGLKLLCERHNILLIADEIFTGFGRTGAWLAVDHVNVVPDIMCVGKAMTGGMPIAACVARSEIMAAWETPGFVPLHGSTFMANPVSCAAAITAINELEKHDLITLSAVKGAKFLEALRVLQDKYEILGDVRGKGLAIAIELVQDRETKAPTQTEASRLVDLALHRGVNLLVTRYPIGNVVALSPPLVITDAQLDYVLDTIEACLDQVVSRRAEHLEESVSTFQ